MAKQKLNKVAKSISFIVIVLVLIALIGGIVYLTRGGKDSIKTFSMKIGDKYILRNESNLAIKSGDKITVNSSTDYSVSVYAFSGYNDFEFEYDDEVIKWSDCADKDFLQVPESGLKIDKQSDGFTLNYTNLADIISTEKKVTISDEVLTNKNDKFCLKVTSNDSEILVYFHLEFVITSVIISPDKIII